MRQVPPGHESQASCMPFDQGTASSDAVKPCLMLVRYMTVPVGSLAQSSWGPLSLLTCAHMAGRSGYSVSYTDQS